MQGGEIKRTAIGKGKNPVFEELFMVPANMPALEFIALDKEGGVKAVDDVIGGGVWNCAEATSRGPSPQPFQSNELFYSAFVPITYEGKTAGRIILEVQMNGGGFPGSGFGSGFTPGMMTTTGGGYTAQQTTTTTSAYGGAPGYGPGVIGGPRFGSMMAPGSPYPVGGVGSSFVPPPMPPPMPPSGFVSGIGGGPRAISPVMSGMGRPISPPFMGGPPPSTFVGGPPGGFIGAPAMNRPVSVAGVGAPMGMVSSFAAPQGQVVETTTTTVSNGPGPIPPPPMMNSGIMNSGPMGSVIAAPVLTSGIQGSFIQQQPQQVTTVTTSSNIAPQMASGLRRSFVAPPLPPLPPPQQTSVVRSGIMQQPTVMTSGFGMNPGVTGSYIAPGATTVTEVDTVTTTYTPPTVTSNIGGGMINNVVASGFGGGVVNNNMMASGAVNNMMASGALGMAGFNQIGGAVGPVSSVGGGAMMPGPTGVGVDMAGRMVDMGRIRLEKIEHYPSYNLFSMLDDHPPMATFRVMPHKLRNY